MYIYIKTETGSEEFKIQNEEELKRFVIFLQDIILQDNIPGVIGLCINDDGTNPRNLWLTVTNEQQLISRPIRVLKDMAFSILNSNHIVIKDQYLFSSTPSQVKSAGHQLTDQDKKRFFLSEEIQAIADALKKLAKAVQSSIIGNSPIDNSLLSDAQHILVEGVIAVGDEKSQFRARFKDYLEDLEPRVLKAIIQYKPNKSLLTADDEKNREKVLSIFFDRNVVHQLCAMASEKGVHVSPEMARRYYIDLIQKKLAQTNEQVPQSEVIPEHVQFSSESNVQIKIMSPQVDKMTETEDELFRCTCNLLSIAQDKQKLIREYLSQPLFVKHRDAIHSILVDINGVIQGQNQTTQYLEYQKVYDAILAAYHLEGWSGFESIVTASLKKFGTELDLMNNRGNLKAIKPQLKNAIKERQWDRCVFLLTTDAAKQFSSSDISFFLKELAKAGKNAQDLVNIKPVVEKMLSMSPEYGDHRATISGLLGTSINGRQWGMVAILLPLVKEHDARTNLIISMVAETIYEGEILPQELFEVLTGEQMKYIFSLGTLKDFMSSSSPNATKQACLVALEKHGLLQPLLKEAWKNYKKAHPEEPGRLVSALFCQSSEARTTYESTQKPMGELHPYQRMISRIAPIEAYIRNNSDEPFAKMMGDYLNRASLTAIIRAGAGTQITPTQAPSHSSSLR